MQGIWAHVFKECDLVVTPTCAITAPKLRCVQGLLIVVDFASCCVLCLP